MEVLKDCDTDRMGYFDIEFEVKSCDSSNIVKTSYMDPNGSVLKLFTSNHGVMKMIKCIMNGIVSAYVEANEIVEDLGENEVDNANEFEEGVAIGPEVSDTDDGMSDIDFSSKDEEHLEARRNLKWARLHEFDNNEAIGAPYA
ncbi:conserved hypothetical protein [Ricinus communis]|uniref:PB1-like domain-containing protein n=1 Tax=Ricinus communis TaxID=3988 RepID=B9RPF0_RICCO|nr:conserved hypothetical protein [Ricinus communis]